MLRNGGEDRWQELSKPYYHENMGINMNGFGIYSDSDNLLDFFCDKSKIENLRGRVVDKNAIPVTIPVIGTDERNNNFHIAMKNALLNHTTRFLINETDARHNLEKSGEYLKLTSKERMKVLLPYVQTDITIIDEAIKLQQVIKRGFISLETVGSNKRDRIVATEYANYFFHLKELNMIKKNQGEKYDDNDWQLWA